MSLIPPWMILLGTAVVMTYLPKALSNAMDSIGGAAGFKRTAASVIGAVAAGGTTLAAGQVARAGGALAARGAGKAAAAGNLGRAARLTRVAALSNRFQANSARVARSSLRQFKNTVKDETGLGGLTPLPHDDIVAGRQARFFGDNAGAPAPRQYRHGGTKGVPDGHLHTEVHGHGVQAERRRADQGASLPALSDAQARQYAEAYRARSMKLQEAAELRGERHAQDPRTPVASPVRWRDAPDATRYYDPKPMKPSAKLSNQAHPDSGDERSRG